MTEDTLRRVRDNTDKAATAARNEFAQAVMQGEAYRVSKRHTLAAGEEFTVHIDPNVGDRTVHIEPPSVLPEGVADIDVWENADPQTNLVDDLFVHNMRYDTGQGEETPGALIQRVTDGGLDTTPADKTEESRAAADVPWNAPQGAPSRGIWRTIPPGETISMVVTDRSSGSGNVLAFDTVVYEGDILPE